MIHRLLELTTNTTNASAPTNNLHPCVRVGTTIIYSGKTPIFIPVYKGDCPSSNVPLWYWLGPLLGVIGLIGLCVLCCAINAELRERSFRSMRNVRNSFRRPQSDGNLLFSCCNEAPAAAGNAPRAPALTQQQPAATDARGTIALV